MIKRYNNLSLLLGAPGLILQFIGKAENNDPLAALGWVLLIAGLCFYAKAKGQHPAWGLLGLLSILGVIILSFFKDKTKVTAKPVETT